MERCILVGGGDGTMPRIPTHPRREQQGRIEGVDPHLRWVVCTWFGRVAKVWWEETWHGTKGWMETSRLAPTERTMRRGEGRWTKKGSWIESRYGGYKTRTMQMQTQQMEFFPTEVRRTFAKVDRFARDEVESMARASTQRSGGKKTGSVRLDPNLFGGTTPTVGTSVVQLLVQCMLLLNVRSSVCAHVHEVNNNSAAKLEEQMWSRYSCNGTERSRAQECIKDGEKLSIWLRRQMRSQAYEKLACYADKAAVKHYVKAALPQLKTATTLGVFTEDKVRDLLQHSLPPQYVMKATHGSNMSLVVTRNHVYGGNKGVLHPSQKVDREDLVRIARQFMGICFRCKRQAQYRTVIRAVIIEEFIGTKFPIDYKVYVFNRVVYGFDVRFARVLDEGIGKLQMKTIRIVSGGEKELGSDQISKHFKFLQEFPPDVGIQQILGSAKVLAEGFRFVRIDFYYVNNTVYFGELTMSPLAGSRHLNSWFRDGVTRHIGVCES